MSAKHVVVPHFFPALKPDAILSPKFLRLTKTDVRRLSAAGLLECVNEARRLWRWTHLGMLTRSSKSVSGGLLSLEVNRKTQMLMAAEMAGTHSASMPDEVKV